MSGIRALAHDSGDGLTVAHCPFDGGGQVIGRSDGTIECQFCNQAFTIQVQPLYSGFPQTVNGMPFPIPGMPGQIGGPPAAPDAEQAAPPFGADEEADANPFAGGEPDDADPEGGPPPVEGEDPDAGGGDGPPPSKKDKSKKSSYLTVAGARLSAGAYAEYLAIRHSTLGEREDLLAHLRAGRGSRGRR